MLNTFILCLASIFGIGATYFIKHRFELNTVRASAISIIVGCCIQQVLSFAFPDQHILTKIHYIICGASFCGMSSTKILNNWFSVLLCAIVYTFIYILSDSALKGIGGGLGTGACLAVLFTYSLLIMLRSAKQFIPSFEKKLKKMSKTTL